MSSAQHSPCLNEADVVEYLVNTPAFFERHAQMLASVTFGNPYGQRALSLHERQTDVLRDKIKELEYRLMEVERRVLEMARNGNTNIAIFHKLHQWACSLLLVQDAGALPQAVEQGMRMLFDVPQVALRLWDTAPMHADAWFSANVSQDVQAFASSLSLPFCGPNRGFEATAWLPDAQQVRSLALLPLRQASMTELVAADNGILGNSAAQQPAFGLLVLASSDPQRFDTDAGTDFLVRMAELASAALLRLR